MGPASSTWWGVDESLQSELITVHLGAGLDKQVEWTLWRTGGRSWRCLAQNAGLPLDCAATLSAISLVPMLWLQCGSFPVTGRPAGGLGRLGSRRRPHAAVRCGAVAHDKAKGLARHCPARCAIALDLRL